ncbi:MAG: hypothetical protein J2P30_01780 [Actinobacteria bacterium]|nr:hypothetical protein [Actinomycetota bacterium]
MGITTREERQEEFLSTLRKSQDIALDAIKTLVETIQFVTPAVPAIHVPTPREVVAGASDFAEHLLANQREFADEVITVTSQLLPGKADSPVVTHSEGKPAAGKAAKRAAA